MENLTKTQIILLALLISFVVSIATGIVTVALLERSPDEVPQTINRVIQQTIEKVTPSETKTVIIKEEDLVIEAIAANQESAVSLSRKNETGTENLGSAYLISKDGFAITENKNFSEGSYVTSFGDKEKEAKLLANDKRGFSVFQIDLPKSANFSTLGDSSKLKAGQTLIFLSENISRSTFTKFGEFILPAGEGGEATTFDTIKVADSVASTPALVINLDGEAVGLAVKLGENSLILPANLIKGSFQNLTF